MVPGAAGCTPEETSVPILTTISPKEAADLIQSNRDNPAFVIIDVRTPEEFAGEHIANAVNIDYYAESFKDKISALDKNKTYLVYCLSGSRSRNALKMMAEMGFREVYDISGGIAAWKSEGLPIVK